MTKAKKNKATALTAAMLMEGIKLPGFTNTVEEESWQGNAGKVTYPVFKCAGDGITMKVVFHEAGGYFNSSGHTEFTTDKGVRTFDRTGVEDSFYVNGGDDVAKVQATMEAQVARVATSRARIATMVSIPGLPFMVDEAGKAEVIALLKAGKAKQFMPSGFGTGYRLYTGQMRSRYDKRAQAVTETFFGVSPIFIQGNGLRLKPKPGSPPGPAGLIACC